MTLACEVDDERERIGAGGGGVVVLDELMKTESWWRGSRDGG